MKEYRIIVGIGEDRNGSPLSESERENGIGLIQKQACESFGGFSMYAHVGGWRNDDGQIVREDGRTFAIFTDSEDGQIVRSFAIFAGNALGQHSVCMIGPDGSVQFIEC